jgi:hypothetical protein
MMGPLVAVGYKPLGTGPGARPAPGLSSAPGALQPAQSPSPTPTPTSSSGTSIRYHRRQYYTESVS